MNKYDILKLSFLNIKSKKFKNIIYILIIFLFMTLIISFFSGKKSFLNFVDNYLNSDFHFKTIAVEVNDEDSKTIVKKLKEMDNKHVSTVFENNDFIFKTVDFETDGVIELYGNYNGFNYSLDHGKDIESDNEMICSNLFYPGVYTENHDKNSYIDMNLNIGKEYSIHFDKKYVINETETKVLNEYDYKLKLVGTFDAREDMSGYNICYVSVDFFEKIKDESTPVFEKVEMEQNRYKGLEVLVLVDEYKNADNVLKQIKELGLNARYYFQMDLTFFDTIITVINIVTIIIICISILCVYIFAKNSMIENKREVALYQLIGYNSKSIFLIFVIQYMINTLIALVLSIICSNILVFAINYFLSMDPNYSVLVVKTRYFEFILYLIILFSIIVFVIYVLQKKYLKKYSPIMLMTGEI